MAGHPVSAHWGQPDPAAATGTHEERLAVFLEAFRILQVRVQFFLTFRFKELKSADIQTRLSDAGTLVPE